MEKERFKDIDSYIASFPGDIQNFLQELRKTIHMAAPESTEKISYGMPTSSSKKIWSISLPLKII
ncbi:MAG: hypothetical protein U5K51_11445 [Flavobacteriaceae bacterium]|nr:hypothetical protein [Flavobacteriaceae bacterium]